MKKAEIVGFYSNLFMINRTMTTFSTIIWITYNTSVA